MIQWKRNKIILSKQTQRMIINSSMISDSNNYHCSGTNDKLWQIKKGVYNPPDFRLFPNIKKRQISISDSIHSKIGFVIGKDGANFYRLTEKYNLLYIFYTNYKIELYGENDHDIMEAVKIIIKSIKYLNFLERKSKAMEK